MNRIKGKKKIRLGISNDQVCEIPKDKISIEDDGYLYDIWQETKERNQIETINLKDLEDGENIEEIQDSERSMPRNKRKIGDELTVVESLNVLKRTKEMVQKDENEQVKSEVKIKTNLKSMIKKYFKKWKSKDHGQNQQTKKKGSRGEK